MGICLLVATSNNYMQAFRWSSLYYAFLQGGAYGTSPNKNELHLQYGNPIEITITIAKYTSSSSLFARTSHLEGEKVSRSTKRKVDLPLGSEVDSY
jgi:hypothetical protein